MRRLPLCLLLAVFATTPVAAKKPPPDPPLTLTEERSLRLPRTPGSFRFAVIGDSGTGKQPQYDLADRLASYHDIFPFETVLMLGDNLYGGDKPKDFVKKFEAPYKVLLDAGVKFYAVLGNHDDPKQRYYKPFHMSEQRYYTFTAPTQSVRFIALDSSYMDPDQVVWLERTLRDAREDWKICFFHHPLYSSGKKHGSDEPLRESLEPLFVKYGVHVVLSGHEHFYERLKPQLRIAYFISGAAGQVRVSNIQHSDLTARGFDQGLHFLLFELVGDDLHFQAVSELGRTVDEGVIHREKAPPPR